MKKYATSAQLKARAREQLSGHYSTVIGSFLTAEFFVIAVSMALSNFTLAAGIYSMFFQIVLDFLATVFAGLLICGLTYQYLLLASGQPTRMFDVFHAFYGSAGKTLVLSLVINLTSKIWYLPGILCLIIFSLTGNLTYLLGSLLFLLAALPVCIIFHLMYSQAYYILWDFPELSAKECLAASRRLMKGSKGRRFYMELSFLPLELLALLSCCIGYLFLSPYMYASYTNFYLDLVQQKGGTGKE